MVRCAQGPGLLRAADIIAGFPAPPISREKPMIPTIVMMMLACESAASAQPTAVEPIPHVVTADI